MKGKVKKTSQTVKKNTARNNNKKVTTVQKKGLRL